MREKRIKMIEKNQLQFMKRKQKIKLLLQG